MPPRKRASGGARAASEDNPREGQFIQPVRPSTSSSNPLRRDSRPRHAAPDDSEPTPKAPRKRTPAKATIAAPSTEESRSARRARVAHGEAHAYAQRAAIRATSGKPSTVGRATAGAAAGAASGAAIGSVVPGVGTALGAGAGAAVGGVGGGISGSRAKRAYKAAMRVSPGARRALVAEFAVCMVITALSPMMKAKEGEPAGAWMKRMTALMGVFFLLGLVSAAGRTGAKAAAGLGGLITLVLVVSDRNLFTHLAAVFTSKGGSPSGTGPMGDPDAVGSVGGAESPGDVAPIGTVGPAEGPGSVTPIRGWR